MAYSTTFEIIAMAGEDRFYRSDDGLRLHCLEIGADTERPPAICLPGLARSAYDFKPLALALAAHPKAPRRVIAFDYRGRGLSDHDPDWRHYDLARERADFLQYLAEAGIHRAHFIGTSRGGLHIMQLAATHRDIIAGAVFNDIGPVLDPTGLVRIKGYIGRPVAPKNLDEAIAILKIGYDRAFDGLTPAEWRFFAETTFGTDATKLGLRYDPALAHTLDALDLSKPLPESWDLFDKLAGAPVLTIRGANSDLRSPATFAAMGARWRESETMTVAGQGHAPLLVDPRSIEPIADFLTRADARL